MIWLIIIALVWIAFIPINYLACRLDFENQSYMHLKWTVRQRAAAVLLSLLGPIFIVVVVTTLFDWITQKNFINWDREVKW